jgi:septal ring factor EnvC (AmiA/AmiB activator)
LHAQATPYGTRRGVRQSDVSHAADTLLRAGTRPTVKKIRAKIGRGPPNTLGPMKDAWWSTLAARLNEGPVALHRLPESVAHVCEALWLQALDEGRRRAAQEHGTQARQMETEQQTVQVRSHVLTLREGELDARLLDQERARATLEIELKALTGLLRKEQATREWQTQRIAALETQLAEQHRRLTTVITRAVTRHRQRKNLSLRKVPPAKPQRTPRISSKKRRQSPPKRRRTKR